MKNKINLSIIILFLICVSIVLICNKNSDNTTLDEVKLKDNEVSKKQFAVYIRNSKNEEYQEYNEDNLFPVGYELDVEQSGCVDDNGEKVTEEGIITQTEDNKINLKSNKTVYCYLYFEKSGFKGTGLELLESNPNNLTSSPVAELYRYIGTADNEPNNYICFGSTTCNSADDYMYRIIGITEDGQLKLIKNKALDGTHKWHSGYKGNSNNAVWDVANSDKKEADLRKNLNSTTFLDSITYVPNGWKDKIDKTKWNTGDVNGDSYAQTGGDAIYNQEKITQSTTPSEIGLMYLSDYYYSLDGEGKTNCRNGGSDIYAKCKTSWLHISNNGINDTNSSEEWTMTRYGYHSSTGWYRTWLVGKYGSVSTSNLDESKTVRPVFYLTDNTVISSGSGSLNDPFIIN